LKGKYTKVSLIFTLVLVFFSSSSNAQIAFERYGSNYVWDHWYGQVSFGGNAFFGDMSSYDFDPIKKLQYETSYGYSGSFGKWINSWMAVQITLSGGELKAVKNTNTSHTSFFQYGIDGVINVTQLIRNEQNQSDFYGYLKVGYGLINFNAYIVNENDGSHVSGKNICSSEEGKVTEWVIPFGAGIVYNLDKNYSFLIETSYQYVNTDKLDAKCHGDSSDRYINVSLGFRYTFDLKNNRNKYRHNSSRKGLHWVK